MGFIKQNSILLLIILAYSLVLIKAIDFGIPNPSHPFTYHMDEWHQLMAVRSLFSQGSSNVLGAANGPIFYFLLSGIFLGPFYVFQLVDPFVIKSSLTALSEQQRLFEILRLTSLLFGIGSIVLVWHIAKSYVKSNPVITTLFFVVNPVWIMLSNYFKYDIALVFWILVSLFCFFRFSKKPLLKRYILFGIAIGCALATKISSMPLIPIFLLSYFFFTPSKKRRFVDILYGIAAIGGTFFIVGIPDSIFHARAYYDFFYLNIVSGPGETANYIPFVWQFLLTHVYPLTFGHGFYGLSVVAFGYYCFLFFNRKERAKQDVFLLFILFVLFLFSLASLKIQAIGNRVIVIVPFMAFFVGLLYQRLLQKKPIVKYLSIFVFCLALGIQLFHVAAWLEIKHGSNPREEASLWMKQEFPSQKVGLENIPIYQLIPDLPLKEFYTLQDNPKAKTLFSYEVIDAKAPLLPKTIFITNKEFEMSYLKKSSKKDLLERMKKEGYKEIKHFTPSWGLYRQYTDTTDMTFLGLVPLATITFYQK